MTTFVEMDVSTGEPTGRKLTFDGFGKEAVSNALYTARLTNGNAVVGPTGCVVYPHGPNSSIAWVIEEIDQSMMKELKKFLEDLL